MPTPTPDPLYPWDTYPRQGYSPQQLVTFVTSDGAFYGAWFHGYAVDYGTIMNADQYAYDIDATETALIITHGDSAPVDWLPSEWEYIYGGHYWEPLISVNGMLDGCENPYPTPVPGGCTFGPPPADPFTRNDDDFWLANFAGYPPYPVYGAHGALVIRVNADITSIRSVSNSTMNWDHRVVYP